VCGGVRVCVYGIVYKSKLRHAVTFSGAAFSQAKPQRNWVKGHHHELNPFVVAIILIVV